MKEITLVKGASFTMTKSNGETVSFIKGKPKYFADDDYVVNYVNNLSSKERSRFRVYSDIKSIRLPADWMQLPKHELKAILASLERDTDGLVHQTDYVNAVNKAIEDKLIDVVKPEPTSGAENIKMLIRENANLKKRIDALEKENEAQKKAYADILAEVRHKASEKKAKKD